MLNSHNLTIVKTIVLIISVIVSSGQAPLDLLCSRLLLEYPMSLYKIDWQSQV